VPVDEPVAETAAASTGETAPVTPGNGTNGLIVPRRRHRFIADEEAVPMAPAPVEPPQALTKKDAKQLNRLRARKVRRIVRHVDPWSVLKLSLLFYASLFVILMVSGIILWNVAAAAGTISSIENFIRTSFALETFNFRGPTILQASVLGGAVLVVAGSGLNVLIAVLFNLISDLVGGIRITVIEEETTRPISVEDGSTKR
jgi:hypothetical protein